MKQTAEPAMDTARFARFFVRFHGFVFLFWAAYDLLNFPIVYDNFRIVHEHALREAFVAREFLIYLSRIALQLLAAALLLGRTDKVISFVLNGGRHSPAPSSAPDA